MYIDGFISYPRTETSAYPASFDLSGPVHQQKNHVIWGLAVQELIQNGIKRNKKGEDVGDHPPITPMRSASPSQLSGDSWRIYEYVTRHFLATVSEDCVTEQTKLTVMVGETEKFTAKGN